LIGIHGSKAHVLCFPRSGSTLVAKSEFDTFGATARELDSKRSAAVGKALASLVVPAADSIGVRLLKKMGYREDGSGGASSGGSKHAAALPLPSSSSSSSSAATSKPVRLVTVTMPPHVVRSRQYLYHGHFLLFTLTFLHTVHFA
jgi:hypothetical protein